MTYTPHIHMTLFQALSWPLARAMSHGGGLGLVAAGARGRGAHVGRVELELSPDLGLLAVLLKDLRLSEAQDEPSGPGTFR